MSEYFLVTKFYNEQQLLPRIASNVAQQTLRPSTFIFIDDGSIDGSSDKTARMTLRCANQNPRYK